MHLPSVEVPQWLRRCLVFKPKLKNNQKEALLPFPIAIIVKVLTLSRTESKESPSPGGFLHKLNTPNVLKVFLLNPAVP